MKLILAPILFGILLAMAYGQTVCTDKTAENISSRGIKIGWGNDEVTGLFAASPEEKQRLRDTFRGNDNDIGYETFGASPKPGDERFRYVSHYGFEFLDNRLVGFSTNYLRPRWLSVGQFRDKLAESFDLPAIDKWKSEMVNRASIDCGNYQIKLWILNDPTSSYSGLQVSDTRVRRVLDERRSKINDKQREKDLLIFKP